MAASAENQQVADDRNIIVKSDGLSAGRAGRSGVDKGFPGGQTVDANIEKTSDTQAEYKCSDGKLQ